MRGTTPSAGSLPPFHGESYFLGTLLSSRVLQQGRPVFSVLPQPELPAAGMPPSLAHPTSEVLTKTVSPPHPSSVVGRLLQSILGLLAPSPKTFPAEQA